MLLSSSQRRVGAALFCAAVFLSCSKDEKKAETSAKPFAAPAPSVSSFQSTALTLIPEQSVGFFLWQMKHPAYKKVGSSSFGNIETEWVKAVREASGSLGEVGTVLKEAGLDPEDEKTWRNLFAEAAAFASPASDPSKPGAVGLVLKADSAAKLADKLDILKTKLPAAKFEVKDLTVAQGKGVSVRPKDAAPEERVYVGWTGDVAVFASAEWPLDSVLTSKGDKVPTVVTSANFTRATRGLPADDARFATGYLDIEKASAIAEKLGEQGAASVEKFKSSDVPLKGIAFAMGMDEYPQTTIRLAYDPADGKKNEWLSTLNASSDSSKLIAALPAKPLIFVSVDGEMLRRIRASALASAGGAGGMGNMLTVFDQIKRLGISARAPMPGQSMLPMPEVLILAESNKPAETQKQLQELAAMGMSLSGMGAGKWTEGDANGTKYQAMTTPFGVGVFLATTGNVVVAASSQSQLQAALSGSGKSTFASALPGKVGSAFGSDASIGNLYIDFEQVAGMMESAGGMLAMYAPEGADANQLAQAENIEALRRMGSMVGVVRLEDGIIGIDSFSPQSKPSA